MMKGGVADAAPLFSLMLLVFLKSCKQFVRQQCRDFALTEIL